jgi:hypothetical protein
MRFSAPALQTIWWTSNLYSLDRGYLPRPMMDDRDLMMVAISEARPCAMLPEGADQASGLSWCWAERLSQAASAE